MPSKVSKYLESLRHYLATVGGHYEPIEESQRCICGHMRSSHTELENRLGPGTHACSAPECSCAAMTPFNNQEKIQRIFLSLCDRIAAQSEILSKKAEQPKPIELNNLVARMVMIAMIRIIPHECQRYPTVGDWTDSSETADCLVPTVSVSDLGNRDYEFLIAMHELTEMYLCQRDGVSGAAVTAFDRAYELHRPAGFKGEPGDCPDAPYYEQHRSATRIEMELAEELGVDWEKYSAFVATIH